MSRFENLLVEFKLDRKPTWKLQVQTKTEASERLLAHALETVKDLPRTITANRIQTTLDRWSSGGGDTQRTAGWFETSGKEREIEFEITYRRK